jgi:hypothetical protein
MLAVLVHNVVIVHLMAGMLTVVMGGVGECLDGV